jgi:hypothetical protein
MRANPSVLESFPKKRGLTAPRPTLNNEMLVSETWRREHNEERPKKGLGGLTPAAYAKKLTTSTKAAKVTAGF